MIKFNYETELLKSHLSHCIGKSEVEVYGDDYGNLYCFHYGALICAVGNTDRVIYNTLYYDYSNSTGRVRNTFIKLFSTSSVYTLNYLHKAEEAFKQCEIINTNVIFSKHKCRYDYNIDIESYNKILSKQIF